VIRMGINGSRSGWTPRCRSSAQFKGSAFLPISSALSLKPTIRNKLRGGFGAVLLLLLAVAAVGTYGVFSVRKSASLNALGLSIQARNLEARVAEKEFRLQIKTLGVAEAKKQYIGPAMSALNEVKRLAQQAAEAPDRGGFESIAADATVYADELAQVAAAFERRGHVDTGAEGEFREAVHGIEAGIEARRMDKAEIAMLSLRRSEKDYLLRGGDEYIVLVHDKVKTLADLIGPQMRQSSDLYLASFDALVDADRQVAAREKICKAASDRLAGSAQVESDRSMARMRRASSNAMTLVVGFSVLALVAGAWSSRKLSFGILAPVNHLKDVAENISLGNLDIAVRRYSEDEIGDLSDSFARMVTAVKFFQMEAEEVQPAAGERAPT
jgi:HAMP domain-containing protein